MNAALLLEPEIPGAPSFTCAAGTPLVCSLCGVGLQRVALASGRDWCYQAVSDDSTIGRNDKPEYDLGTYLRMCDAAHAARTDRERQKLRDRAEYFRRNFYGWNVPWSSPAYPDAPGFHTHTPAGCPSWCDHRGVAASVPDCCAWPMWWGPRGWTCRKSGQVGGC